jgi:membrane-bound ClpP family serine protease
MSILYFLIVLLILITITLVLVFGFIFIFRTKTKEPLLLETEIDSKVNVPDGNISVGMEGRTLSRLASGGKAIFGDNIEEVFSQQDFIDENQPIVVTKIECNKIIVKLK